MQNIGAGTDLTAIALGFASGNSLSSRYLHLRENILHYCLLKHEITVYYSLAMLHVLGIKARDIVYAFSLLSSIRDFELPVYLFSHVTICCYGMKTNGRRV